MSFQETVIAEHHGTKVEIQLGPIEHFLATDIATPAAIRRELSTDDLGSITAEALPGYPEKKLFGSALGAREYMANKLLYILSQKLGNDPSFFNITDKSGKSRIARIRKDGTIFVLERWSKSEQVWKKTRGQVLQVFDPSTNSIGNTIIEP